ncbi:MAG: molecular chaperone DnaK [Anaerolineae bacterium]
MSKIIGIDLGTTNTVAAVVEGFEPRIIRLTRRSQVLRSVVALSPDGRWLVGQTAHNQAVANPRNTIYAVKRLMGRNYDDEEVRDLRRRNHYSQIVRGPEGRALVHMAGNDYRPEQIAAILLSEVKQAAERELDEPVTDAVISIPANADPAQRQATLLAGQIAGLNVRQLINEPTAIGLAYHATRRKNGRIAVYDMGGGTFDVSFMSLRTGELEVIRSAGRPFLGGDDFDAVIVEWIRASFKQRYGLPLKASPEVERYLYETAESAKIALSQSEQTALHLPFIAGERSLDLTLHRSEFEKMVDPLVQRSLDYCTFLRNELGLDRRDFDAVLLAGGMSRMPLIQRQVMVHFEQRPRVLPDPEHAVALGAAIQGAILAGDIRDILLKDIAPLSLGIRKEGGLVETFIPRNTPMPCTETRIVTTAEDNQTRVVIAVYQGERPLAEGNRLLAKFALDNIPPAPRGVPKIEVTFTLDQSGVLTVSARDVNTGQTSGIRISEVNAIDADEVERMISITQQFARVDRQLTAQLEQAQIAKAEIRQQARERFGTGRLPRITLQPCVFLSYAHTDGLALARQLERDLSARGFTVFWDRGRKPEPGELSAMEFAINQADVVLALLTPDVRDATYIRQSWQHAINRAHKPVIPLLAPGFDPGQIPSLLNNAPPLDFRGDYTQALELLAKYLHEFGG